MLTYLFATVTIFGSLNAQVGEIDLCKARVTAVVSRRNPTGYEGARK
jgi:hypothetical protein